MAVAGLSLGCCAASMHIKNPPTARPGGERRGAAKCPSEQFQADDETDDGASDLVRTCRHRPLNHQAAGLPARRRLDPAAPAAPWARLLPQPTMLGHGAAAF